MTYGSATTAEHVRDYFTSIYKGKASEELIQDFENRYRLVGRSPLIDITAAQARLLGEMLGDGYIVKSGMRHSAPFIHDVVAACKEEGATSIIGIILSPQFSSFIMEGYCTALQAACTQAGYSDGQVRVVGEWSTEPHFIQLLATRVTDALRTLRAQYGRYVPVLFTTHSLPERVVKKDPSYLTQLQKTIDATVVAIADPDFTWVAAYQSAGHTPEEWLKPDIVDILRVEAEKKTKAVLIAPIQFLADHLEILYDLDIAGREQCAEMNVAYNRIELPNTHPLFIESLAALVHTEVSR